MVDIPPPPVGGNGSDDRAAEEQSLFEQRPPVPALADHKAQYLIDLILIKRAFLASVRGVCYVLPWLAFSMLLIWLVHIVGPASIRWLSADEVGHLQTLMFSGALSALGTAIATKQI